MSTNSDHDSGSRPKGQQSVQTTGHVWDDNLQEYNNPLPGWWLWAFYATFVFAIIYWVIYPSFPVGDSYTKGLASVTFETDDGETKTMHWNTRAVLERELDTSRPAVRQQEWLERVGQASYEEILADPEKVGFARAIGQALFGDNCAGCHGRGGGGVPGLFPNLVDDAWLWGGEVEQIEHVLVHGRLGYMPSFPQFDEATLGDLASYVLSLSGHSVDTEAATRGEEVFQGYEGGCHYCHTREGVGLASLGAANLTDAIWTVAKVPQAETLEAKKAEIVSVIHNGIRRVMPAQQARLRPEEIRMLAVYVHQMGGGS